MADIALSFLLTQLSTWISEESQLLGSLRGNAELIRDEMSHMKAFLRVADAKEEVDPQLKEWVNQVRQVAYDVEDLMDTFMLRFAGQPRTNGFSGFIKKIYATVRSLKVRHQVSSKMQEIQTRVKNISEGHQRYKDIYGTTSDQETSSARNNSKWYDGRGDALLLEEAEVVGIEKPKKKLIEWLSSSVSDSGLKVISVVGSGGLGKTTLVRKVYDDATVTVHFSTHVWMTISNSFRLEEFLRTMIRRLVAEVKQSPPQGMEAMDADEMKEFIYKFLQHRSYIVVLDDIWRVNAWGAIRYAFPRRISGVKYGCVIITTRFHSIGQAASIGSNDHVYNLEPLNQEESKKLFHRRAFVAGSCPTYLEEIAGIILKKCEGLPLAIVVISSLLATKKNNIEEWKKFQQSLSYEIEGNDLVRLNKLLSLSYYDLPYYLKSCLLYFSVFPEDHVIYRHRLIRLWMAEGFIQPMEGKTMEEVAEDNLQHLIDRCLIQVVESTNSGADILGAEKIRVHDILLAIILSKSKEQSFVTICSGGVIKGPDKCRRLAIHGCIGKVEEIKCIEYLRSILSPAHQTTEQDLLKLLGNSSSRLIKVLELRGMLIEKIPEEIFKLYNLKYLSLKYTKVKVVLKSIEKLQNLETLDLRDTNVTELPVEILKLLRLRHFLIYSYKSRRGYRPIENGHSCKAPYRIGCFSSLQTLYDIEATEAGDDTTIVREIGKLTQLKKMGIMKLREEDGKDLCSSLTKLNSLNSLYIATTKDDEIIGLQYYMSPVPPLQVLDLRGRLQKVPQWIPSLNGLNRLSLRWSRLNDNPLDSLQHLPNLSELELYHAYQGNGLCFIATGFQKLKKLWLLNLQGLQCVTLEEGSMPLLQELYMWDCKLVDELPTGIEHLKNLQYVDFSDMSEGFVQKLERQKKGGNKWKLAYIPKIEIYSLIHGEWEQRRL